MPLPNKQDRQVVVTNVVRLAMEIAPSTVSDDDRSVDMAFYTGATVERWDWNTGEKYLLRLGLEPGQCDIQRLEGAPLLDSHRDYTCENVLGVCRDPRIEDGVAKAKAMFSDDEDSDVTFRKVKNGILRSVSVGAVIEHIVLESEEEGLKTYLADKWYPREVSVVPIPADPRAGFLSDQLPIERLMDRPADDVEEVRATARKEMNMAEHAIAQPTGETSPTNLAAEASARQVGAQQERERINGIRRAVRVAKLSEDLADKLIERGVSLDAARAEILENLARIDESTPTIPQHSAAVTHDQREKLRDGLQNAIEFRAGLPGVKLDAGRNYAGMSLLRLAEESLRVSNVQYLGATPMELAAMSLGMRVERFANPGYGAAGDFPLILANVMNKSLRAAYDAYPQTWRPISRVTSKSDFKLNYVNQLSESPTPEEVKASGEYKYVSLSEKGESYRLKTYGNIIALNRQAIINDDMSAFNRIPSVQGRACAQMESDIVWALITSNPTMGADNVALFHAATHGNLAASGAAIDQTTLGAGRSAMRLQKNIGGAEYLNIEPRYLAVPAEKETIALQQTSNQYVPQQGSNVNTFRNLQVIVEPRLSASSNISWYLFADPGQIDIIEVAYLAGQEAIYTETRVGFDVDGMEMKVREDFGAQILDWRGCYKNPGA